MSDNNEVIKSILQIYDSLPKDEQERYYNLLLARSLAKKSGVLEWSS